MAKVELPQGEQGAAGFSDEPKNLSGLFEKMMTQVLSTPSASSASPKEESQASQSTAQSAQLPVNFSNKMPELTGTAHHKAHVSTSAEAVYSNLPIQSKTVALSSTASKKTTQSSVTSNKDKKTEASAEPASTPTNPGTFIDQVFAIPVLTVDPIGKSDGDKASKGSGSATSSETKASEVSTILPAAPVRANASPVSMAAARVPAPQLSAAQMTLTTEASAVAQQTNAATAKQTASAKNIVPTATTQASASSPAATKTSDTELPESQTVAGVVSSGHGNLVAKTSDSSTNAAAQPQPETNGTSIAKQDMSMKQAEKTTKVAGQTEKVLPGNAVYSSRGSSSSLPTDSIATTVTATAGSSTSDNVNGLSAAPADSVAVAVATNTRANALERTQELVTVSAARLSDTGNNSMQVVIKPDSGTQLSLELRQQGGNVEVQAALQQGDFNHLNQQWPDLQQRLEEKGIRLAPLTDDGASSSNNSGSETFQNSKQSQSNDGVPEMSLMDSPVGMFTTSATAQPSAHRGWETWA